MNRKEAAKQRVKDPATGKFAKKYQAGDNLKNGLNPQTAANSSFIAMPEINPPMPPNPAVTPMAPGIFHVNTYRSIASTPGGIYRNLDEALRASPDTAKAMLNDVTITGPLFQRWMSLCSYNDGLYPEDENDPKQVAICEEIMQDIENIPQWTEFKKNLMWGAWHGKAVNIIDWDFGYKDGRRKIKARKWFNILGDKLIFRNNGRMGYLVHMPTGFRDVVYSDRGMAELFMPEDQDSIVHHKYFLTDTTWDESQLAIGVEGFGYRHYLYWTYWLKQNLLEWMLNAMQIVGAMGLRIGYFEQSNPESEAAVAQAMAQANNTNIILFPRPIGDEKQGAGLEIISPQGFDPSSFKLFIDDYFGKQIEKMLLGWDFEGDREDYYRLQCYDARGLEETISRDLVSVFIKYNYPQIDFDVKYKISVPFPDTKSQRYVENCQRAYEMGLPIGEAEFYNALGLTMPSKNKKVIVKPANTFDKGLREEREEKENTGPMADGNQGDDQTIRKPKVGIGNLGQNLS
jgi:hypothetical protein